MTTTLVGRLRPEALSADVEWAWQSGACTALGHHFELLIEPDGVGPQLVRLVAPFRTKFAERGGVTSYRVRSDGSGDLPFNLYAGDEHLMGAASVEAMSGMLAWHLNRSTIDKSADTHVLLHASAASRAGMTVILPADMESGKTTTVAGLLKSGFDYITDEAVAIDPTTGRVKPFPKMLSLDPGSWPLFPECRPSCGERTQQWHVDPGQLGARTVRATAGPPRFVVFPRYVAGADTSLTPVSRAEAVSEMARMTFHFSRHPGRNLSVIKQVTQDASLARLVIGSLDDAIQAIEELISSRVLEEL